MKRCSCGTIIKRKYWKKCGYCRAKDRTKKKEEHRLRRELTDAMKIRRKKDVFDILIENC